MEHTTETKIPDCNTCASISNDKDGVPDMKQLFQLNNLKDKVVLRLKTKFLKILDNTSLETSNKECCRPVGFTGVCGEMHVHAQPDAFSIVYVKISKLNAQILASC